MKKKFILFVSTVMVLSLVVVIKPKAFSGSSDKQSQDDNKQKDKTRNKTPQSGDEWFDLAYELHQSDRYQEAIEAFKKAVELDYRKATAMYNIACGYAMLSDTDNALMWLEKSLENGFNGSSYLFDDSDLDSLRTNAKFRELLKQVSANNKETKLDRLEATFQKFERLQQTTSQDGDGWYSVGKNLLLFKETDRAIVAFKQAINFLGYQNESAMYRLACAYAVSGNRDSAFEWLNKAIDAGYDNLLSKDLNLASLSDDPRFKAIEEKSRTLSLSQFFKDNDSKSPNSKKIWASAAVHFESYLQREPTSGRGWFNLGYALHYASEHQKAIAAFDKALSLGYRKPTSMYNLACANAMSGNRDVAIDWLEKSYAAGFDIDGYLKSDKDLESLRNNTRFKALQEKVYDEPKSKKKH